MTKACHFLLLAFSSMFLNWSGSALAQANSGHLAYNPSSCSIDAKEMVYFAVGQRVLRQPAVNLVRMVSYSASERVTLPLVEHPEEPEGCPGHPIQQPVYYLSHLSVMSEADSSDLSRYTDAISVIINDGDLPNSQNRFFDLMCKRHKLRDDSVPGFLGCKKPYACNEDVAYQAVDYRSPDGTLLAINCRATCSGQIDRCSGGYLLSNALVVNFSFQIGNLPVGRLLEADQELRRRLAAAEVKDFKWRDSVSLPDSGR